MEPSREAAAPASATRWTLLTGMSATGKSSVVEQLVLRGYRAVDADYGFSTVAADGEWLWDEGLIGALLASNGPPVGVLAGTARNQGKFYDRFAHVVLLSAPLDVMLRRLEARTNNPFGKVPAERTRIVQDLANVEPLLRAGASVEVDTDRALDEVVDAVLRIVEAAP